MRPAAAWCQTRASATPPRFTAAKRARPNKPAATGSTGCRRRRCSPRASARMLTSFLNCRLINQARGLITRAVEIDYHAHNIRWTKSRSWHAVLHRKSAGRRARCPFTVLPTSDPRRRDSAQPFMWLSAVRLRSTMHRRDVGNSIAAECSRDESVRETVSIVKPR